MKAIPSFTIKAKPIPFCSEIHVVQVTESTAPTSVSVSKTKACASLLSLHLSTCSQNCNVKIKRKEERADGALKKYTARGMHGFTLLLFSLKTRGVCYDLLLLVSWCFHCFTMFSSPISWLSSFFYHSRGNWYLRDLNMSGFRACCVGFLTGKLQGSIPWPFLYLTLSTLLQNSLWNIKWQIIFDFLCWLPNPCLPP